MSGLKEIFRNRIESTGPIPLDEFMADALMHPEYGYYQKGKTFGKEGDFITAPEISQMFGELIGLWCIDTWVKMGTPSSFNLIELGPGNGTLMSDILRSSKLVPEFGNSVKIHLVEASKQLTQTQQANLSSYKVNWHTQINEDLLSVPFILIGNEFLDALPIKQFVFTSGEWRERKVSLVNNEFAFVNEEIKQPDLPSYIQESEKPAEGTIAEHNAAAASIVENISDALVKVGGAALFIDYGYIKSQFGDSFQSLRKHNFSNPLENPGEADLTSHVNFDLLSDIAKATGCAVSPIANQGRFLERLGIEARTVALSQKATAGQKEKLAADLKRLTSQSEMGTLFKVMALHQKLQAPPEGFI